MISLPLSLYFTLASTDAFNLSGLLKFTLITYISVNHLVHQSYKNLTVIVLFVGLEARQNLRLFAPV
jgi:hypothetical protein